MTLLWAAANAFRSQKNVASGKKYFLIELSFIVSVDLPYAEKRILLLTRNNVNRLLLGYQPATLLSISLQMAFFE